METVDRAVSASRFGFRALLSIGVAACIFVFSPERSGSLNRALDELNTLTEVNLEKLVENFIFEQPSVTRHLETLASIAQGHEFELVIQPLYGNSEWVTYPNLLTIRYRLPNLDEASLEEIASFFSINAIPFGFVNIEDDTLSVIAATLEKAAESKNSNQIFIYVNASRFARQFLKPKGSVFLETSTTDNDGLKRTALKEKHSITRSDFSVNWPDLLDKAGYSKLLTTHFGRKVFLPGIKDRWDSVRTETIVDARTILARSGPQEISSNIEVLGIKIPAALISSVIPIALFAMTMYLFLHLRHLLAISPRTKELQNYPWIPLMPGMIPLAVSFVIIVLLPAVITIVLVFLRSDLGATWLTRLFGIGSFPVSILCYSRLIKLRTGL